MTYKELSYNHFYDSKKFVPLSELADVVSGIFLRSGEVFVLENFEKTADASLGFSKRIHQEVRVEPDISMPLLQQNANIAYLNPKEVKTTKGVVFIESKQYSRTTQRPLQHFVTEHPLLSDYVTRCGLSMDKEDGKGYPLVFNVLSSKQSEHLFSPKHILSVKEDNSQSFFDDKGSYAIQTGMYGVSAICSNVISNKVLTAIFNSHLFGFIRFQEEKADEDNRQARYESIARFPIPAHSIGYNQIKALELLSECLISMNGRELDSLDIQVEKCLRQIVEMIVFELYFGEYMLEKGLSVSGALSDAVFADCVYNIFSKPLEIYNWFQTSANIIRQKIMLLDSRSPELLYPIFMQYYK